MARLRRPFGVLSFRVPEWNDTWHESFRCSVSQVRLFLRLIVSAQRLRISLYAYLPCLYLGAHWIGIRQVAGKCRHAWNYPLTLLRYFESERSCRCFFFSNSFRPEFINDRCELIHERRNILRKQTNLKMLFTLSQSLFFIRKLFL